MKLLLASNNMHKKSEMSSLLLPHQLILPQELNLKFDFEENGATFIENALGKAQFLYDQSKECTLADDSGLIVDALDGEPGIFSARYGFNLHNRQLDADERNRYLLSKLEDVPYEKRSARFVCAIALILSNERKFVVQESVEGFIATKAYGKGGFGYDPIFIVENSDKTMAELSTEMKNQVSHRAKAAKMILKIIEDIEQRKVLYVC
jgi:XTP/dITP diphosphohydrolase